MLKFSVLRLDLNESIEEESTVLSDRAFHAFIVVQYEK